MKQVEILSKWRNVRDYQIDRIQDENGFCVVFRQVDRHPHGVVAVIRYQNVGKTCCSPMMNWNNLIRCSNYYVYPPEEDNFDEPGYMSYAVQKGLKPAATFRCPFDSDKVRQLRTELPSSCLALPYKEENTTFFCRKGKLADFYDINDIQDIYSLHGIYDPDWGKIKEYCNHEISFFADNNSSGISIERGAEGINQTITVGLLLGYPIESTVAAIKRNAFVFRPYKPIREVKQYFELEDGSHKGSDFRPWIKAGDTLTDPHNMMWRKVGNDIFLDGQQESLYYDF